MCECDSKPIMKVLEISYGDDLPDVVRLSPSEFEEHLKMALASKLFELGRLSSGQASEIAGLSRTAFLKQLSLYQVAAVAWNPEEFADEIEHA